MVQQLPFIPGCNSRNLKICYLFEIFELERAFQILLFFEIVNTNTSYLQFNICLIAGYHGRIY